jgi:hypothetical protein
MPLYYRQIPGFKTTRNNVISSRSLDTVYQNTTGVPIYVLASTTDDVSATMTGYVSSNSSLVSSGDSSVMVFQEGTNSYSGVNWSTNVWFIVPSGFYYKISGPGASVFKWYEYLLSAGSSTFNITLNNVFATRTKAQTYQNTTGNTIYVQVVLDKTATGTTLGYVSENSSLITNNLVWAEAVNGGRTNTLGFFVPPGYYYRVDDDTSSNLLKWWEYSISLINPSKILNPVGTNIFASRTINVIYQNTTGKTIYIQGVMSRPGTGTINVFVDEDYSLVNTLNAQVHIISESNRSAGVSYAFFVPPGHYYVIKDDGNNTPFIGFWQYEMDIL